MEASILVARRNTRWMSTGSYRKKGEDDVIRVLMTRKVPKLTSGLDVALLPTLSEMLIDLRSLAHRQPGYISGETLRNVEDPTEYLVISNWKTLEDWKRWLANKERAMLEGQIDALLGSSTVYKVFGYD